MFFDAFHLPASVDGSEGWRDDEEIVSESCDFAFDGIGCFLEFVDGAFEFDKVFVFERPDVHERDGVAFAQTVKNGFDVFKVFEHEWPDKDFAAGKLAVILEFDVFCFLF